MTVYTYRAGCCGKAVERDFPMGEAPQVIESHCVDTGVDGYLTRVYSVGGVSFKGSGFYSTDNRKGDTDGKTQEARTERRADRSSSEA